MPRDTKYEDVKKHFERYGKIAKLNFVTDSCSGEFKGYCFIEYNHRADAKRAYREAHGKPRGNPILVDIMRGGVQKGWRPRRLGGGYGGNIKSSQLRFGGREQPHIPTYK